MNAAAVAQATSDREREETRVTIRQSRALRESLAQRIMSHAPDDDLRRQAKFYIDRMHAGGPDDGHRH